MNKNMLTISGSVASALASSACCWLPLALMGIGFSAAGIATLLGHFRPVFLIAAVVLLGVGFYLNYFRKERCAPDSACAHPDPRIRRINRGALWISTVLVAAFMLFPNYVGLLFGTQSKPSPARLDGPRLRSIIAEMLDG